MGTQFEIRLLNSSNNIISLRMIICKFFSSFGIIFTFIHLSNGIGFGHFKIGKRFGRVIRQQSAKCGSNIAVGVNERIIFSSEPNDAKREDIHFVEAFPRKRRNKTTRAPIQNASSTSHPLDLRLPNVVDLPDEKKSKPENLPKLDKEKSVLPPGGPPPAGLQPPAPAAPAKPKSAEHPKEKNAIVPPNKNDPPKQIPEQNAYLSSGRSANDKNDANESTTAATTNKKPSWRKKYLWKPNMNIKMRQKPLESVQKSVTKDVRKKRQNLISPDLLAKGRMRFPNLHGRNKRSVYYRRRTNKNENVEDSSMYSGRSDCKWTFTMKRSCHKLVAHVTRFKAGQMRCEEQYLEFKGASNEKKFCDATAFWKFVPNGNTLTIDYVKSTKAGASANFEGYVTCEY